MADNEQVADGLGGTITVSMDETASGQVQRFKLAYSADGVDTHVPADASGVLVNLGTNNDVTLTSGTLTAIAGTVTTSSVGTAAVALSGGTATVTFGTASKVGLSNNGTAIVDILSLTSGTALAVGLYDSTGAQLSLSLPLSSSVSPTMDAATYTAGDSLQDASFSISNAVTGSGRTCHLLGLRIIDKDDQGIDLDLDFFRSAPSTVPPAQDPYTLDDTDSAKWVGRIDTATDGVWHDLGGSKVWIMTRSPIPFVCTATTLYMLAATQGAPTYTASGLIFEPTLARD